MCLIAHRPVKKGRGSNIPAEVISYNRRKNPDGFGIAWREFGKVHHAKFAPSDGDAFEKLLRTIDRRSHIEYVAHWRLATHGAKCEELSHPFPYEDPDLGEVLLFHNGIIDIDIEKGESDTSQFVKQVLSRLEGQWWRKPHLRFLVEGSIGWSRLAIMTKKKVIRINEDAWKLKNGIWYSTEPTAYSSGSGKVVYGSSTYKPTTGKVINMPSDSTWKRESEDDDAEYARWQNQWEESRRQEATFDENDADEDDGEETKLLVPGESKLMKSGYVPYSGWLDNGHWVVPVSEEFGSEPGYSSGTATCTSCSTIGEYYMVDSKMYTEIKHPKIRLKV